MDVSLLHDFACYTTEGVVSEIKNHFSKQKIETAIISGSLIIATPDPPAIREVKAVAQKTGDLPFLSTTDIDLIALAITLRNDTCVQQNNSPSNDALQVVTDDYSIQNVLSQFNISVHPFMQKGINQYIRWLIYCPLCKKTFKPNTVILCPECEIQLKRRPIE